MVLFLHNRYRTTGGEERVLEDLIWLVREHLGEDAEILTRSSSELAAMSEFSETTVLDHPGEINIGLGAVGVLDGDGLSR